MKLSRIIATGLGSGLAPFAPGTVGSILGICLIFIVNKGFSALHFSVFGIQILDLSIILLVLVAGVWAIKKVHKIEVHDSSIIVIDEIVGVWIGALVVPMDWRYYLAALVLFRFFDIYKPLFIKRIDNLSSDWSVMLDDVLAGIYTCVALQLYLYFKPFTF